MADQFYSPNVESQPRGLESLSTEEFLTLLGQRIRFHRTAERMSRKRLAEVSGVSERYLAQLEAGQGNMSISLLRKVTTAIGLPLNVLLGELESDKEVPQSAASGASTSAATSAPANTSRSESHSAEEKRDDKVAELS